MADSSFPHNPSSILPDVSPNIPSQDEPSPRQAPDSLDDNSLFGIGSPWRNESLTLPPLNPSLSFEDHLPPLHEYQQGDISWSQNPNPFADLHTHSDYEPPPSNQQEQHRPASQYRIEDTGSPDPFEAFLDLQKSPPPRDNMPPRRTRNSTRSSIVDLTESSPQLSTRKRRAGSPGEGRAPKLQRPSSPPSSSAKVEVVDLADVENEADYEALKAKEQEAQIKAQNQADAVKPIKLAEFQCIICMDNPTDLTVTHCGHLFCSECLHQALHAGDKKCCPVCRTVINTRGNGRGPPKNGIFALEMKLMTANKKGKRPVRAN